MSGRKCKNCGGSDIEVDTARGDAVCTTCGSVLEHNIIVSEVQFEEGAHGSSNAIGQFVSADSKGGATKFGASFHMGVSMESREQTLKKARNGITQLCNHLRLNQHCIDTACNFFRRALAENLTRGRRSTHVYAACVYLTCRIEGTAPPRPMPATTDAYLSDFVCGMGAAFVTTSVTFPINKLIYRQILEGGKLMHAFETIRKEGPFYLYRGGLPPLIQKAVSITTMFGVYNSVRRPLKQYQLNEYVEKVFASTASGTLEACFMPFERVQVLLVHAKYNQRFRNMFHAFRELKVHYGLKEYYRGFMIIWLRNICSNSCFFLTKAELQKLPIMNDSKVKEGVKNFCSGGLLGLLMSTVFYPMKVMKIFVHEKIGGRYHSVYETAIAVYRKNGAGMKNFYPGVAVNGARSLLSWGITNMVYEFLRTIDLLIDISDILQICCYKLGRAYLRLTQALSINIPSMDPCIYIMRYAAKLEFGKKMQLVANTASRLVQRMKRDSIHSGRRPSGLCGAAILLAARLHDIGRTPGDIVKIVPIHKTTLRKRMLEFGDTPSSSLTLDEFMTVDLEEEQDPPSFKAARKKDKERLQKLMEEEEESFTELQKQIELQLEKNMMERKPIPKTGSCLRDEDAETNKFIEESTLGAVNEIIQSAVIDDPEEEEVIGLGPDISSMGLVNSLDDISTSVHQPTEELEIDSNLDDLDDNEIDTYILTDTEHQVKKEFWYNRYSEYLEQQKIKQEKIDKEREEGKPEKKRKRSTKKKSMGPANSAGEAIEKIIQEKKLSSKINYDVLRSLNAAPVQTEEVTIIEDETSASTSESIKRRKLHSLSDRLDKVSERGRKRMMKDVGLPFFQGVAKDEVETKEVIEKKEELEKDGEDDNKKVELLKDEEQTGAAMLEEDLDEYYEDEEEDQPAEESTNELGVLELLRQHRGDGEDFGYDYDYEEADY